MQRSQHEALGLSQALERRRGVEHLVTILDTGREPDVTARNCKETSRGSHCRHADTRAVAEVLVKRYGSQSRRIISRTSAEGIKGRVGILVNEGSIERHRIVKARARVA